MGNKEAVSDDKDCSIQSRARYTTEEDMAILNYMIADKRFLKSCGNQVWKDAVKLQICPGRPFNSLRNRFRTVIVRNLRKYNVDKDVATQITQFMRADPEGKAIIRSKQSQY